MILTRLTICIENIWHSIGKWTKKTNEPKQLHDIKVEIWRKEEGPGCSAFTKEGGS